MTAESSSADTAASSRPLLPRRDSVDHTRHALVATSTLNTAPPTPESPYLFLDPSTSRAPSITSNVTGSSFDHTGGSRRGGSIAPDSPYYLSATSSLADPLDLATRIWSPTAPSSSSLFPSTSATAASRAQGATDARPTLPSSPVERRLKSYRPDSERRVGSGTTDLEGPSPRSVISKQLTSPSQTISRPMTGLEGKSHSVRRHISHQDLKNPAASPRTGGLLQPLSNFGGRRRSSAASSSREDDSNGQSSSWTGITGKERRPSQVSILTSADTTQGSTTRDESSSVPNDNIKARFFRRKKWDKQDRSSDTVPAATSRSRSSEQTQAACFPALPLSKVDGSPELSSSSSSSSHRPLSSVADAQCNSSAHITPASSVAAAHASPNSLGISIDKTSCDVGEPDSSALLYRTSADLPANKVEDTKDAEGAINHSNRASCARLSSRLEADFDDSPSVSVRSSSRRSSVSHSQSTKKGSKAHTKRSGSEIPSEVPQKPDRALPAFPTIFPDTDPTQKVNMRSLTKSKTENGADPLAISDAGPVLEVSEANLALVTSQLSSSVPNASVRSTRSASTKKKASKRRSRADTGNSSASRSSWTEPMARSSSLQSPECGPLVSESYAPSPPLRSSSSSFGYYDAAENEPCDLTCSRPSLSGGFSPNGRISFRSDRKGELKDGSAPVKTSTNWDASNVSRSTSYSSVDSRWNLLPDARIASRLNSPILKRASSTASRQTVYEDAPQNLEWSESSTSRLSRQEAMSLPTKHRQEKSEAPSLPAKSRLRYDGVQSDTAAPTEAGLSIVRSSPQVGLPNVASAPVRTAALPVAAPADATYEPIRSAPLLGTSPVRRSVEETYFAEGGAYSLGSASSDWERKSSLSASRRSTGPASRASLSKSPSGRVDSMAPRTSADGPAVLSEIALGEHTADVSKMPASPAQSSKARTLRKVTAPALISAFRSRKSPAENKDAADKSEDSTTVALKSRRWGASGETTNTVDTDGHGILGFNRTMKRQKSREGAARPEIRRIFLPAEREEHSLQLSQSERDDVPDLPGEYQWARNRASSAGSGGGADDMMSMKISSAPLPRDSRSSIDVNQSLAMPQHPTANDPGPLWCSGNLDSETKRLLKRRNVIRELVHTERSYASDLAIVRDVYLAKARPMAGLPSPDPWSAATSATPADPSGRTFSSLAGAAPRYPTSRSASNLSSRILVSGSASPAVPLPSDGEGRMRSISDNSPLLGTESNRSSILTTDSKTGYRHDQSVAASSSSSLQSSQAGVEDDRSVKASPVGASVDDQAIISTGAESSRSLQLPASTAIQSRESGSLNGRSASLSNASPFIPAAKNLKPLVTINTTSSPSSTFLTPQPASSEGSLTLSDIRIVFAGIDQISAFADEMSVLLEAAMGTLAASPLPADACNFRDSCDDFIGRTFRDLAERIHMVFGSYCSRHEISMSRLHELSSASSQVAAFLKGCNEVARQRSNAWDLPSLLIKPVQRMLKYPLLLQEILSATPSSHPDHDDLILAIGEMQKIADAMNELERRREILHRIVSAPTASPNHSSTKARSSSKSPIIKTSRRGVLIKKQKSKSGTFGVAMGKQSSHAGSELMSPLLDEDDSYPSLAASLKAQEEGIIAIHKRMLRWSVYAQRGYEQQVSLLIQWSCVYRLSGEERFGVDGQSEAADNVMAMSELLRQTSQKLSTTLDAEIHTILVPALTKIRNMFAGPHTWMSERDGRKSDYARYKALVSSAKDGKLGAIDRKLIESANGFVALHTQLLEELPSFVHGIEAALEPVIVAFARTQSSYHKHMLDLLQHFAARCRLTPSLAVGAPTQEKEEEEADCPPLTALTSREATQRWWNTQRPVAEAVEELHICNSSDGRFDHRMEPSRSDAGPQRADQSGLHLRPRNLTTSGGSSTNFSRPSAYTHHSATTASPQYPLVEGRLARDATEATEKVSPRISDHHSARLLPSATSSARRPSFNSRSGGSTAGSMLRSISGTFKSGSTPRAESETSSPTCQYSPHASSDSHLHNSERQPGRVDRISGDDCSSQNSKNAFVLPTLDLGEEHLSPVASPHAELAKLSAEA